VRILARTPLLAALAIAALLSGCATTTLSKPDQLAKARFHTMAVKTPPQQVLFKTLAPNKITVVTHHRRPYYVFPDAEKKRIFVGTPQEYAGYRKMCARRNITPLLLVQAPPPNGSVDWNSWFGLGDNWSTF